MNMKEKIYNLLFAVLMALFCTACNEEWTDEQYEHYVSFKAPMDYARGVTDIYVKYKLNGAVTYQLPVIMSGSTLPGHDTEVQIAIDSDTLKSINWEYFHNRTDLYYKELTSDYYEVENMNVVIPADDCVGLLNVNFKLGGIDLVDKWVLPLTIRESPIVILLILERTTRKHCCVLFLLMIIPVFIQQPQWKLVLLIRGLK